MTAIFPSLVHGTGTPMKSDGVKLFLWALLFVFIYFSVSLIYVKKFAQKKTITNKMNCYRVLYINVRENRRGKQEWKIQRNWQHRQKTKTKKNTTQYVLDITIHKYRK